MRFCKRSLCHPGNQTIDDALINGIFGGVAGQFRLHHSKVEKRWSGYRYSDCFSWSKGQFWRVCLIIDPASIKAVILTVSVAVAGWQPKIRKAQSCIFGSVWVALSCAVYSLYAYCTL